MTAMAMTTRLLRTGVIIGAPNRPRMLRIAPIVAQRRLALTIAAGKDAQLSGPLALAPEAGREPLVGEASAAAETFGENLGLAVHVVAIVLLAIPQFLPPIANQSLVRIPTEFAVRDGPHMELLSWAPPHTR